MNNENNGVTPTTQDNTVGVVNPTPVPTEPIKPTSVESNIQSVQPTPIESVASPVEPTLNVFTSQQVSDVPPVQQTTVTEDVSVMNQPAQESKIENLINNEPVQESVSAPVVEQPIPVQQNVVSDNVNVVDTKPEEPKQDAIKQTVQSFYNEPKKKKSKAVPFLVFIIILLCLGIVAMYLYYNGYLDKYIGGTTNSGITENKEKNTQRSSSEISYNKDGEFIKELMETIIYKSYIDHDEFKLYSNDVVTVDDLSDGYKNNLIVLNMRKVGELSYITESSLVRYSKKIFGKNIYSSFPDKLEILCGTYKHDVSNKVYNKEINSGGCGGAGYLYFDYITKVDSKDNDIYVYQKVAFQGKDGVYKNVSFNNNTYSTSDLLAEYKPNSIEIDFDIEKNLDKLNEYKFKFTYDKENNIYYFVSVEKVK